MKTKPAEPIATAFPTCGEVFHFVIAALDLTAWADVFHQGPMKRRSEGEIKDQSDRLRDWAVERDDRVPSRDQLEEFIGDQLSTLPQAKDLHFILTSTWANLLENYAHEVCHNASPFGRRETRAWCAQAQAPRMLYFLWVLQKMLMRMAPGSSPILVTPLDALLSKIWPAAKPAQSLTKFPLQQSCYLHYADACMDLSYQVDANTISAWKNGDAPPSFEALGRRFATHEQKLGLILDFAFAKLVEATAAMLKAWINPELWPECRRMLIKQARCVHSLDDAVSTELSQMPNMSTEDYSRLLGECLGDYMRFLEELSHAGLDGLDITVARYRVHIEYDRLLAPLPTRLGEFTDFLEKLWQASALQMPQPDYSAIQRNLAALKSKYPEWSQALQGPLFVVEARITLGQEQPDPESLDTVWGLYQQAVSAARYQAGGYAVRVIREALGFAALLHRRESGEGSIKPWLKNMLDWWDLLGMGDEFSHETLERRIELAEIRFTDGLHHNLRTRLKRALPKLGLQHENVGGFFGITDPHYSDRLRATPLDPRQKRPMMETVVGRMQTPLMEAIDRRQLEIARNLVNKGDDLNFINSTGDTCVTKAFACKYYSLILEILQRDENPIQRDTLLLVTEMMKISALEQTLSTGQIAILREMTRWKDGRGDIIDLNKERVWGQTPLYYTLNCLAHQRMKPEQAVSVVMQQFEGPAVTRKLSPELIKLAHQRMQKEYDQVGVIECIAFMIRDLQVDLEGLNVNNNTALTFAAEKSMRDIAGMLLAAGASVNHQFVGGGTALVRAIQNDDCELGRLLLEYGANPNLYVDALGRPIHAMTMSEKMRQLVSCTG